MMAALLSYLHRCFIRSYRYGPPSFVFIAGIFFIYTVVPNPVMDSYGLSTTFLFIVTVVLCYSLIDLESVNQESITLLHAGSIVKLYIAKLLYCWLYTVPLALFAVLYPFLFNKFNREPLLEELIMAFLYHILSSWLAVVITGWFSRKFIQSRFMSFLSLCLLVAMTLAAKGIQNELPIALKKVTVLIPPLQVTVNLFANYETATALSKLLVIGATLLYSLLVGLLLLLVINKRKLDSSHS